jgi:cell division protein FtsA
MKKGNLVVGLDVGTTKTCVVVGEVRPHARSGTSLFSRGFNGNGYGTEEELIDVIGFGSAPSKGIRKGMVVNIEGTVESIRSAVREAESMADIDIKAVHVGFAGGDIHSFSSHGVIAVKEKEIGRREIDRVIDAARAIVIPLDREVLHVVPLGFSVDGQNGISDPAGMSGVRLEADVRVITGGVTSVRNLVKSCHKSGLDVLDIILEPLASAEATLSREEKELGVGLVDIGGGTTDIALFHKCNVCHTALLTVGGNNFTNDIAIGLRLPSPEAERIKKRYGCAQISMVKQSEEMDIFYPGGKAERKMPRQYLAEVLQPRAEELFYLVKKEIQNSGYYGILTSGIVLTGGTIGMKGLDVMAENILELPVRIGNPRGFGGMTDVVSSPMFATGIGLVFYAGKDMVHDKRLSSGYLLNGIPVKMKEWAKSIFK